MFRTSFAALLSTSSNMNARMDPAAVRFNRAIAPVASTVAWQSVGKWAWRTSTSIEWDEIAKGTVVTTVIDNYQESSVVNLVLAAAKCHAARFWIMFRSTRLIAQFAKSATEFNWQRDLLATYPPRRSTAAHAPRNHILDFGENNFTRAIDSGIRRCL